MAARAHEKQPSVPMPAVCSYCGARVDTVRTSANEIGHAFAWHPPVEDRPMIRVDGVLYCEGSGAPVSGGR